MGWRRNALAADRGYQVELVEGLFGDRVVEDGSRSRSLNALALLKHELSLDLLVHGQEDQFAVLEWLHGAFDLLNLDVEDGQLLAFGYSVSVDDDSMRHMTVTRFLEGLKGIFKRRLQLGGDLLV